MPFPIVHDQTLELTKRFTELHPKGGPGDSDITRPTTVVIGKNGKIKFVSVYDNIRHRPDPDDLLRIVSE
jgi:peroxiredoxin